MILIVIDQLTKERYNISYTINKNNIIAQATTYLLFNNIWNSMASFNHSTEIETPSLFLVSKNFFYKIFDIKINLYFIFSTKTNRKNEIDNHRIERYFCTFVNYQ